MTGLPIYGISTTRNECPYLLEYVAHYLQLGFDKIIIATNDNTDNSLEFFARVSKIAPLRYVAHTVPADGNPQQRGHKLALAAAREEAKDFYVFPNDADEFLFLLEDQNIREYIARFPETTTISFNWKFFGSNGHATKPPGLVMENYTYRCPESHRSNEVLKTLSLHNSNMRGFGPHLPHYNDASLVKSIYSDGELIDPKNFEVGSGSKWITRNHGLANLRHFGLKSRAEFANRRARGDGFGQSRDRHNDDYFSFYDKNEIYDPPPAEWVSRLKENMQKLFADAHLSDCFDSEYFGLAAPPTLVASVLPLENPSLPSTSDFASAAKDDSMLVDEIYHKILAGSDLSICDLLREDVDRQIISSPEKFTDPNHPRKYLDHSIHLRKAIKRAIALGLHKSEPKKILDIGTGAGYFPLACRHMGHSCSATEVYSGGFLGPLIKSFGIKTHIVIVNAFEKLPDIGEKFDIVTSYEIAFSRYRLNGKPTDRLWSEDEWKTFIEDVRGSYLVEGGIIWLSLNPHFPKSAPYSPELLAFFERFGAQINGPNVVFR